MKIKGEATYIDTSGKLHRIEGKGILPDDTILQKLKIDGKLVVENISCEKISIDGKCNGGIISANNFTIDGKIKADTLKIKELLRIDGKAEVSEIEADEVIIESHSGFIGEIKCRKVKIFNNNDNDVAKEANAIFAKMLNMPVSNGNNNSRILIKNIDAVKVDLANCEVDCIKCKNAIIGKNCVIEKLIVEGEYEIADDSKVIEIVKEEGLK